MSANLQCAAAAAAAAVAAARRVLDMDWFGGSKKTATEVAPPPAAAATAAASAAGSPPSSPSKQPATPQAVTQKGVATKEIDELSKILGDAAKLRAIAADALQGNTLELSETLEELSDLSSRLLCRNRCRESACKFGHLLGGGATEKAAVDAVASALAPSYFRHSTDGADDGSQTDLWVSKAFLHNLPNAPEGVTLCARFSLCATAAGDESGELLYDLSLKVMQIAPYDADTTKFSLSFALADVTSAAAADYVLDESQRSKLAVLQSLLGLGKGRFTPIGVLGIVMAGAGCGQLDEKCTEVLRAAKEAHRNELLAASGSLF